MLKAPRPRIIGGITVKVTTGCGNMYVQMNWCGGKLFEVFATLGRSGGCAMSQIEALTRSITTGLRCNVLPDEYEDQLRGIGCPNQVPFPKESAVSSCSDAIAKTLAEFGNRSVEDIIDLIRKSNEPGDQVPVDEEKKAMEEIKKLKTAREEAEL
jgi:ribonucleoside-diphosphate reductase alpha chain